MDQIRPWLFIGAYRDSLNKSNLDFKSIRAMLQLAEKLVWNSLCSYYGETIPYLDLMRLGISKG